MRRLLERRCGFTRFTDDAERFGLLRAEIDTLAAQREREMGDAALAALEKTASEMVDRIEAKLIAARNAAQAATASGRTMLVVATVLAFVLGAFLAISIIRYLTRALADAGALAAAVAEGDLTHTVDVKAQDEVGAMVTSLNRMTENLRRVVGDIAGHARRVRVIGGLMSLDRSLLALTRGVYIGGKTRDLEP